jgi:MoxR-like ATPase
MKTKDWNILIKRLIAFIKEVEVNDYPGEEEKESLLSQLASLYAKDKEQKILKPFITADDVKRAMEEYASQFKSPAKEINEDWILEILDKTTDFAKQLIKDHFNRHKNNSRKSD